MPIVTAPSEWGIAEYRKWADEMDRSGRTDDCWKGNARTVANLRRHFVAAFRGEPIVGQLRNTCGNLFCMNPRHARLASDPRIVAIDPNLVKESDGCHLWLGALVRGVPMLRFTGKNVNLLHFLAERDLQDFRDLQATMAGRLRMGFPMKPIVTRMCGNSFCINPEHFIVSPDIITNRRGLDTLRDFIVSKGEWFWRDGGVATRGITYDSSARWRRFLGLEG